ncbi:hypothetical protein AB4Z01_20460 [Inquilinus sp. YAF38]|uniref:hypothetical protein n=1 Tax=Inquilinus sp. YAF38 TaxID=3233084 RepID=UPI003F914D58
MDKSKGRLNIFSVDDRMYCDTERINGMCPDCYARWLKYYQPNRFDSVRNSVINNAILRKFLIGNNVLDKISTFIESGFLSGRRFEKQGERISYCYEREIQQFIVGALSARFSEVVMEAAVRGTLLDAGAVGRGRPSLRFRENSIGRSPQFDIKIDMLYEEQSKPAYVIEVKKFNRNGMVDYDGIILDFKRCVRAVNEPISRNGSISCGITCFDAVHEDRSKLIATFSRLTSEAERMPAEMQCGFVCLKNLTPPSEWRQVIYNDGQRDRNVYWGIGILGFVSRIDV